MRVSLVLDASAVVKWFVEEDESSEMRRIRDLYLKGRVVIHIPSLLLIELANALRYVKGLTPTDVANAVEALRALRLNIVDDTEVLEEAIETAFNTGITVYDAIYVALAKTTDSKLVTYDAELLNKFKDIARKAGQAINEINTAESLLPNHTKTTRLK